MKVNPALITATGRQAAALQAQGQGDAVQAHVGGDWAQHSQVNVFATPYLDAAGNVVGAYTLRLWLMEDLSPVPQNVVLALPMVVTGSTPGAIGGPPIIISQSPAVTAAPGTRAELSVTAISGAVVTYQWYRAALLDGSLTDIKVAGASASKLVFDAVTEDNAGQYRCLTHNEYGDAASGYITLVVTGS